MLEGRKRIGGRVFTLFDVPGHPEVGGNTIANAYGRCIAAGAKYGVEIVNLAPRLFANRAGQELYLGGQHVPLKDWPTHPKNPFAAEQKKLPPWGWADAMFKQHMPFKDLENWYDPKYAQYDISVHDFLVSKGATDAMIHLALRQQHRLWHHLARRVAAAAGVLRLLAERQSRRDHGFLAHRRRGSGRCAAAPGAAGAPPTGAAAAKPADPMANILVGAYKGGNQNLPIAMARRVKGDLLQGKRVVAIETSDSGSKVTCSDGSVYKAKAVVCSMPFSTLRHVALDPLPEPTQYKAIQTLGYIPITQFHLVPKKPFWESDGLSPSMWTDGLLGMVLANRTGKTDTEVASLAVWCRGLAAQYIDRFGLQEGGRMIVAELERLRPAAKGLLTVGGAHSWAADPFSAGDWAIFQPGQVTALRQSIAQPHKRLFFCGEHTSVGSRGMEGAFESAERASLEVLGALG